MARFRDIRNNFSSGELSDKIKGQTEVSEYSQGLAELTNMLPVSTGGAFGRMGTRFLNNVYSSDANSIFTSLTKSDNIKIIPYDTDGDEALFLVVRLISGGSSSDVLFGIYNAKTGYLVGGEQAFNNYQQLNYTGEVLPWDTTESAEDFGYIQLGDVIVLVHSSGLFQPIVVEMDPTTHGITSVRSWYHSGFTDDTFVNSLDQAFRVPYKDFNKDTEVTFNNNQAIGTPISTVTAYDTTPATINWFTDDHVGKIFIVDNGTGMYAFLVNSLASTSPHHTVNVTELYNAGTLAANQKLDEWWESAWGGPTDLYPKTVGYFEERLLMGSSNGFPARVWCSAVGDAMFFRGPRHISNLASPGASHVPEYDGTSTDSDPFDIEPGSNVSSRVTWLSSGTNVDIGTRVGEYVGGGVQSQFSNTNSFIRHQSATGGRRIQPHRVDEGVVYVGRDGRSLHQFKYSEQNGQHVNKNLSTLADHMVYHNKTGDGVQSSTFKEMCYQGSTKTLWARTSNNELVSVTIDAGTNVLGWAKHDLGGSAKVISICTVQEGTFDELVLLVKRTRSATDYYSIEKIGGWLENTDTSIAITTTNDYSTEVDSDDLPWWLDCAVYMYSSSPTTSFTLNRFRLSGLTAWATSTAYSYGDLVEQSGTNYICTYPHTSGTFATDLTPTAWATTTAYVIGDFVTESGTSYRCIYAHTSGTFATDLAAFYWITSAKWSAITTANPEYLNGQEVSVIADGVYIGEKTLSTYGLTLDTAATTVIVGLKYTKTLKTLPITLGSQIGTSLEAIKRIDTIMVKTYKSKGGKYGSDSSDLKLLEYDGGSATLETKDHIHEFPSSPDRNAQVILQEDRPVAFNVIALTMRGLLHDG